MEETRRDTGTHPRARRRLGMGDWIAIVALVSGGLCGFYKILQYVFFERTDAIRLETQFQNHEHAQEMWQDSITGDLKEIRVEQRSTNDNVIKVGTQLEELTKEIRRERRSRTNE